MLTRVTGGARSGKSRHAEALIADAPQVLLIFFLIIGKNFWIILR